MERRDFLKYFGIGASVVPLIGGLPKSDVVAKLIEEPKAEVKLVPRMPHTEALDMLASLEKLRMHVSFVSPQGRRVNFHAHTFLTQCSVGYFPMSPFVACCEEFIASHNQISWRLEGQIMGETEIHS